MKDAEAALKERAALLSKIRELQAKLEEEAASRSALKDKAQRKLLAAEQEVSTILCMLVLVLASEGGVQAGAKQEHADALELWRAWCTLDCF